MNANQSQTKRILPNLTAIALEQASAAAEALKAAPAKAAAMTGSPYEAPMVTCYTATKGKNAGSLVFQWSFFHKGNPAWSRRFDATDLALVLAHIPEATAAMAALKQLAVKKG